MLATDEILCRIQITQVAGILIIFTQLYFFKEHSIVFPVKDGCELSPLWSWKCYSSSILESLFSVSSWPPMFLLRHLLICNMEMMIPALLRLGATVTFT